MLKQRVLALLRETSDYVSGQQLCEQLQVSRTAIWKAVNALKADGYRIETKQNRGYCLRELADCLSEAELRAALGSAYADILVEALTEVDSTNSRAGLLADAGAPHGSLVTADVQTAGRGRRGRGWENPAGTNIAMSILLRPELPVGAAPMLTLLAAVAACRAVEEETGLQALIKLPNDLLIGGRKVCGILTELVLEESGIRHVIVGIGVNVRRAGLPKELQDKAVSLEECGAPCHRAVLTAAIYRRFMELYQIFEQEKNILFLKGIYCERMAGLDRPAVVVSGRSRLEGMVRGINETGELLLETDGGLLRISGGEVSLRGTDGYAPGGDA